MLSGLVVMTSACASEFNTLACQQQLEMTKVLPCLQVKLRGLLAGKSVDELQEPWPLAE
jgi:hypothetical protein